MIDAIRDGKRVVGVAFDSIGRFAQSGILRDRMIPRVLAASPEALLDDSGRIDPAAVAACALTDEKPGGHGDRAAAAAALELACWDLNAKLRRRTRLRDHRTPLRAQAGLGGARCMPPEVTTTPDAGLRRACATEMRGYLDLGYDAVKMKIGGAPLREDLARIEAVVDVVGDGGPGRGRRQRPVRPVGGHAVGGRAGPLWPALVRRARRPTGFRAEPGGDCLLRRRGRHR